LSKKRGDESINEVDSTMEQTNFSVLIEKSKNVRFISCRSQASLNSSIISKSSGALSFVNSRNDEYE